MATIRDVAKMSGVSTATVSHVLNGRTDRVSADTRDRVFAAVRALKYKPTPLERNQKAILTQNLAVVAQDLTESPLERHGYFRRCLDGILETAAFRGWSVSIFVQRMWGEHQTENVVRRSYDGRTDGVIAIAPAVGNEIVESLQQRGTPLCLVGTTPWLPDVACVDIDNVAAGAAVARHLIALGHQRLAYVGHDLRTTSSAERNEGFRKAASDAGVEVETLVIGRDSTYELAEALVARGREMPTGILGWHDAISNRLARDLAKFGVSVPGDVSIAGVDDDPESGIAPGGTTTVANPVRLMAMRAATLLIDRLVTEEDPGPPEVIRYEPELIVRGSTGPAPDLRRKALLFTSTAIGTNGGSTTP